MQLLLVNETAQSIDVYGTIIVVLVGRHIGDVIETTRKGFSVTY